MNQAENCWMDTMSTTPPMFWFGPNGLCQSPISTQHERVLEERMQYQALFENSRDAICVMDAPTGHITQVNWASEKLLNRPRQELIGLHYTVLYPPDAGEKYRRAFARQINGELSYMTGEVYTGDGQLIPVEINTSPIQMPDGALALQGFFRDITERRAAETALHWLTCYDLLTHLPNRWQFLKYLSLAQATAQRNADFGAVLLMSLNTFKRINNGCGHEIGDQLLQDVAARLSAALRQGDVIARFGGDEFAMLLPSLAHSAPVAAWFAQIVTDKIHDALSTPFSSPAGDYLPSVSIGITVFSGIEQSAGELIKQAEIAMYRAKELHCDTACFFENPMQEEVETRLALENDLCHALEKNQLRLFLQPQVNTHSQIIGVEALLRWEHPQRGLIAPAEFIPLAEESGLILPIGEWVLVETCRAAVRLAQTGQPLHLAANVSPRQFRHPNFVVSVQAILAATGADPSYLTLEVTEGLAIEDVEDTIAKMVELKALGLRFAVDDFGTGYSSLSYLKRLPIDELKIDKSFVQGALHDSSDAALVETILAVARHLNMVAVAEGVETVEQELFLKERGCQYFQGYRYGRPELAETLIQSRLANASDS